MTIKVLMQIAPRLTYSRLCEVALEEGFDPVAEDGFDPEDYAPEEFGLEDVWATVETDPYGLPYVKMPVYPWLDEDTGDLVKPSPVEWHVPSVRAGVAMARAYREEHFRGDLGGLQEVLAAEGDTLSDDRQERRTVRRECGE